MVGAPRRLNGSGMIVHSKDDFLEFGVDESRGATWMDPPRRSLALYYCQTNGWFGEERRQKVWVGDESLGEALDKVSFSREKVNSIQKCIKMVLPPGYSSGNAVEGTSLVTDGNALIYYYYN
jgi:hypothetical protein